MRRKHLLSGSMASIGILILILDGRTAIAGAQTGIDLCIKTVIPSLFPFFLLSVLLTGSFSGSSAAFLRPLARLCCIPQGSEVLLITGFLGGYPAGAQAVASAYLSGQLRKENAERMLSFCNNAGPAFLFGMVATMFPDRRAAFTLWGIHIGSALLVALLSPCSVFDCTVPASPKKISITIAMQKAIIIMATVCGWVILFRVAIAFLDRWFLWMLPPVLQVILIGILELSNGCCALSQITNPSLRFVVCSGLLAFGGICVAMQTQSVSEGLSMTGYRKGKATQVLFSLLISASVVLDVWIPVTAMLVLLVVLIRKTQKRGSNPAVIGV